MIANYFLQNISLDIDLHMSMDSPSNVWIISLDSPINEFLMQRQRVNNIRILERNFEACVSASNPEISLVRLVGDEIQALKIQIEEQNRTIRLAEAKIQALRERIEDQNHTMIFQRRLDEAKIQAMNGQIEDQIDIMRDQMSAIEDDMQIIANLQRQINLQSDQIRVLPNPLYRAHQLTGLFVIRNN